MSETKKKPGRKRKTVGEDSKNRAADKVKRLADVTSKDIVRRTMIIANVAEFQVKADRTVNINGQLTYSHGKTLKFINGVIFVEDDSEELEIVQKILRGQWSDGAVTPQSFMENARIAGLQIVKSELAKPPIPAWDTTSGNKVVGIAQQAGLLQTEFDYLNAIRYENESLEREPVREPREEVIVALEAELMKLKHQSASEPVVNEVDPAAPVVLVSEVEVG